MFGRYQPREVKPRKEKSKSNMGICKTTRCDVSLFQPRLLDKPGKGRENLAAGLFVQHVGLLQKRCREELPLKLLPNKLRERNKCICSISFYLSLLIGKDISPKKVGCISSPLVAKKSELIPCFEVFYLRPREE